MPRYRATLEYDGGPYSGFQTQGGLRSIQASLERAIQAFAGESSRVHVAGRTDAGVHALAQVVHFDLSRAWPVDVVRDALNARLVPEPISVLRAEAAPCDFHARFSAIGRRYLYRILDRRAPPVLERERLWWVKTPLDEAAMHRAAQALLGAHDFTTFRHAHCQAKSPMKTVDEARVWREGDEVRLAFAARSFLHRQVRSMTGSLVQVGRGRWLEGRVASALAAADRAACGPSAPAHGLYLAGVDYPAEALTAQPLITQTPT